jgi:hypothetical protein
MRAITHRRKWRSGTLVTFAVAMTTVAAAVGAEDFGPVRYDPQGDQLIVTVLYDGTNPNHHFSVHWGRCRKHVEQVHEPPRKIIEVDIIDDQGNDAAVKSYTKTVKVPLAGLTCRPATVTLWTQPNSTTDIDIP